MHILSIIYFLFLLDHFFNNLLILLTFSGSFLEHYISSLSPRRSFHYYQIGLYVTLASIHGFFFKKKTYMKSKVIPKCAHTNMLSLFVSTSFPQKNQQSPSFLSSQISLHPPKPKPKPKPNLKPHFQTPPS